MADIGLVDLRRRLDEAMTYADWPAAERLAAEGLRAAREREWPGEAAYFLAQQAIMAEDFRQAIHHLDAALAHNPADGAAFNDRALCLMEQGKIDAALADLDRGIAAEPDYATVYHNKGWLLNNLGQHRQAVELFRLALAIEPDRAVTHENLADAFVNLGEKDEAARHYQAALVLLKDSYPEIRGQISARLKAILADN